MIEWDNDAFTKALGGKIRDGNHIADTAHTLGYNVITSTDTSATFDAALNGEHIILTIEIPEKPKEKPVHDTFAVLRKHNENDKRTYTTVKVTITEPEEKPAPTPVTVIIKGDGE